MIKNQTFEEISPGAFLESAPVKDGTIFSSLFCGIAVVVDDEILKPKSPINSLLTKLNKRGTSFVKFSNPDEIKSDKVINSFSDVSYIILDWGYSKIADDVLAGTEGVELGQAKKDGFKKTLLSFLKKTLKLFFIPIFIFSGDDTDAIILQISEDKYLKKYLDNGQIYVESKNKLRNDEVITSAFASWFMKCPSIYLLKQWETTAKKCKHEFSRELFGKDATWSNLLYNTYYEDLDQEGLTSEQCHNIISSQVRDAVSLMFNGYMGGMQLDENLLKMKYETSDVTKKKIFSSLKFVERKNRKILKSQTGDLYKYSGKKQIYYLLNISASCDYRMGRMLMILGYPEEKSSNCNHTKDGSAFHDGDTYCTLKYLDGKSHVRFHFKKHFIFNFSNDGFLKIPFETLFEEKSLLNKKKKNDLLFKYCGQIIPPYISNIQARFSFFVSRIGLPHEPPVPKIL